MLKSCRWREDGVLLFIGKPRHRRQPASSLDVIKQPLHLAGASVALTVVGEDVALGLE